MFLTPMTLRHISELTDPRERVPLNIKGSQESYEKGLQIASGGHWVSSQKSRPSGRSWQLDFHFAEGLSVSVNESGPRRFLAFHCSACSPSNSDFEACPHQWAAYILLWQVLSEPKKENLKTPELRQLAEQVFQNGNHRRFSLEKQPLVDVVLDSLSICLDEVSLKGGSPLAELLTEDFLRYRPMENSEDEEAAVDRLFDLPEVFRKKRGVEAGGAFHESLLQSRLAGIVLYNFSNGIQVPAKDLMRSPLWQQVPAELRPQLDRTGAALKAHSFCRWPLLQRQESTFISQSLREVEEVVQNLLTTAALWHRQNKLPLFLQSSQSPRKSMKIQTLEWEAAQEMDWRLSISERTNVGLESEFKLVSFRKRNFSFFESFAVEPLGGTVVIHPWLVEFHALDQALEASGGGLTTSAEMPTLWVQGEAATRQLVRHLRSRLIPVRIEGGSQTLEKTKSQLEIHLNEKGGFFLQHEGRPQGQENLVRRGWTKKTQVLLEALSEGLPFLWNREARELASRHPSKRDWDLRLLKHLGIAQYLCFEALHHHFEEGVLSDGRVVERNFLFRALEGHIQALLVSGSGESFVRDLPLSDLCSKSVLSNLEGFIDFIFKTLGGSEAFYSERGEVILEGIVEKEFRLVFELLRKMAIATRGEIFRRSRTSFLSRITGDQEHFRFPMADGSTDPLRESIESIQMLIPHGFKIFFKGQPLQELDENEFRVDFVLQAENDQRNFNWFELNPQFFLRGEEIRPEAMKSLGSGGVIEYQGKMYLVPRRQIPSLRRLENFWTKLQKGKVVGSKKMKGQDLIFQLPRNQTLELLALRASGIAIRGDWQWKKLCEFYDQLGTGAFTAELPAHLKGTLKPYQVSGFRWLQDLYQLRLGALLADDMGLGKTLQTLCFLEDLREKRELGQVLIVVPSSLIFNWQQEVSITPNENRLCR